MQCFYILELLCTNQNLFSCLFFYWIIAWDCCICLNNQTEFFAFTDHVNFEFERFNSIILDILLLITVPKLPTEIDAKFNQMYDIDNEINNTSKNKTD